MQVKSLNDTEWDIVIAGTGLHQSLLALALSRSSKKILHVDRNSYYGAAEAALSTQEADEWVADRSNYSHRPSYVDRPLPPGDGSQLSFPRAYSLALAPQLIYTQAKILQYLVSSKCSRQLEFQAMGSWWLYSKVDDNSTADTPVGTFVKIPTNREDIAFSDTSIDLRSKRTVMKVLRFVADFENNSETWQPCSEEPFVAFLRTHFKLSQQAIDLFVSLAMSPYAVLDTKTSFALPRIARHLRSIGRLGPGFSSVIPKWGGLSEVAQVGCRAGAVGGAVYVLNNAIVSTTTAGETTTVKLQSGDEVRTKWLVGSHQDIPNGGPTLAKHTGPAWSRAIVIVASKLLSLFPAQAEGAPSTAGSMVIFPANSLSLEDADTDVFVHLIIHSSDTGECPKDQSVIYASTCLPAPDGPRLLDAAVLELLARTEGSATILWRMHYQFQPSTSEINESVHRTEEDRTLLFPATLSADLVFDDAVLDQVESVWRIVLERSADGNEEDEQFLVFGDREGQGDDDDEGYV